MCRLDGIALIKKKTGKVPARDGLDVAKKISYIYICTHRAKKT